MKFTKEQKYAIIAIGGLILLGRGQPSTGTGSSAVRLAYEAPKTAQPLFFSSTGGIEIITGWPANALYEKKSDQSHLWTYLKIPYSGSTAGTRVVIKVSINQNQAFSWSGIFASSGAVKTETYSSQGFSFPAGNYTVFTQVAVSGGSATLYTDKARLAVYEVYLT